MQSAWQATISDAEAEFDAALLAAVEADVADAQAKIARPDGAPPTSSADDTAEPQTGDEFEVFFREIAQEETPPQPTVPAKSTSLPPIRLARGLRASLEAARAAQAIDIVMECTPRRRGRSRRKRVVEALRAFIEDDPGYRGKCELNQEMDRRFDESRAAADATQHEITAAHEALLESIRLREDFHLIHVAAFADRIERCGTEWAFACGSYWCPHCRKRFGARLLEDTQAQLTQRYGADPERWRRHLLYVTILNEIVIPDPDLDPDLFANFSASIVRRDHRDLIRYLTRWQADRRSAMSALLAKRGLSLELVRDWIDVGNRDTRFYSLDNAIADAVRLVALNDLIVLARDRFKSRRKRPDLESNVLISWREADKAEAYMFQLRKAAPLTRDDIIALAQGFQTIDREFRGITKTNYPERLKFKSSIQKIKDREKSKLNRLRKDLPGLSLIGAFELELIDLHHALRGDHGNPRKAETLRILTSQPRKPTKYRKTDEEPSWETRRRREKNLLKRRMLDDVRERIAGNQALPEDQFPGLKYAVLLHMHVVIDLNGTPREDLERWMTGKAIGSKRFQGQWKLPHQVMIKSLRDDKPVNDSLRHISFYPVKASLAFNYDNIAPKHDEELPEGDLRHFNDEALALLAWLQHSIGHESLRITIDWPGVDREKRGPKPKPKGEPTPKLTDEELEIALAEHGVHLPRPPVGQTDISFMFQAAGQAAQRASGSAEASRPTKGPEDVAGGASGVAGEGDPPGAPSSDRGDRGGEAEQFNDTTPPTDDE